MSWGSAQGTGGGGPRASASNNTTVALGSAATYTGTGEVATADGVTVSCKTDNSGTLYFDFSNDGTNWDTFPVNGFMVAADIHEYHTAKVNGRYFRVRLVNDTGAQTYLRLYTYFGPHTTPNAPINQTAGLDHDAIFARTTVSQDEIRIGKRSGVTGWTKFGYRSDLQAASGEQTVWATTGNFTPLTSAETFTITYDGTGGGSTDGAGTNGATELTFYYIDSSGLPAVTAHTLETDGSDVTAFTGLGINRVAVSASGSNDYNTSAITITATTAGTTQAVIPATQSVTQQCIFFTGANHDAVAKYLFVNVNKLSGGNPKVDVIGYAWNRTVATRYEVFRMKIGTTVENNVSITDPIGFNLSPTDVLYFVADTDTNDTVINMRFSLNEYQRT